MTTYVQSQSPANSNPQQRPMPSVPPYQPPTSPEEISREQDRVKTLLEINSLLLEHVNHLQGEGQGGTSPVQNNPAGTAGLSSSDQPKPASIEFQNCMRVVQYNCGWVAGAYGNHQLKTTVGPMIMDSPINNAAVQEKYKTLKELFPGWNPRAYHTSRTNTTSTPPQQGSITQSSPPSSMQMQPQVRPPQVSQSMQTQQNSPISSNPGGNSGMLGGMHNQPH